MRKDTPRATSRQLKIAVLCGGNSPEREVSLKSGERIANALRRRGHSVAIVDPTAEYLEKEMRFRNRSARVCRCQRRVTQRSQRTKSERHGKSPHLTLSALRFCQKADTVFMALHGGMGEDGRIAATLECMNIPHTGSDYRGMCLSMDKALSKRLMSEAGILTPEYVLLPPNHGDLPHDPPFPCVIKPTCGGSSIGVRMIENGKELTRYLAADRHKKEPLLIERRIVGREFTVGILSDTPLAVTEIIPKDGFYNYKNKYTKGLAEEITPANIDSDLESKLKEIAVATHKALCLDGYSRIDLILEAETDRIYVLEANALPGMTETSLLPQGAKAVGIDFDTLCEKMLKSAFKL